MGHLYIPGEKKIAGPWLLDIKALEELDEIFEYVNSKVSECIDRDINSEAEGDVKQGYSKTFEEARERILNKSIQQDKKVILTSHDEKILFDSTISGLLKDPKLKDFKAREFQLLIRDNRYRNEFKLNISNRFDGELEYRVKCTHQDLEDDIKYKVENWLDKHEPNKPKQWWNKYSFFFIFFGMIICGGSIMFLTRTEKVNIKEIYRTEIKQLLDSGVNDSNRNNAIELLLKYNIEYKAEDQEATRAINKGALKIFLSTLFLVVISIFKPKTIIGIGANKRLVKFYRAYSYFVLVTIPSIFILPPLVKWINDFF
jgi:hypothetical protein